ncbi:hypothetical protein [uncultured Winogradskyella sp.]|uniref:hypothetical protein n=1 Tax=uncultured Winogradskyella sp. TaxID=395353 RepID=UPI0030EDCB8D|tara:strand:- start:2516 stop:3226 length:711 start_codon:yes stop_codon:yes gene_type:complete
MKIEQLFTKEQLKKITKVTKTDLSYIGGFTLDGTATETSILTVSKKENLIFTEGNEDTGFSHLGNRHNYFSYINYWTSNDVGISKLDKPSKFHPKMMPILDFVKIADDIYKPENKNITKNSRPDTFDKYTGEYIYENDHKETYHLLLYKDTKIVHTMFPQSKKKNQKARTKYGKGIVTVSTKIPEFTHDLLVPYENSKHIPVYSILIRKYLAELKERSYIQKHNEEGTVIGAVLLG